MTLGVLILLLVVAGVVLAFVPMDTRIRNIVVALSVAVALVVVLRWAGLL